jgi:signal transduction histidine kinase
MRSFIRKEEPHTETCDINRLIRETMDLINAELLQMEIDSVLDLQADLPGIDVDPVQIQQVILNLVKNSMEAIDKFPGGQRCILVVTRPGASAGIEVAISDTGPGLDADIAGKIFTTFVTTKAEGMGIGLSICRSIIEAHGSELVCGPRPGGGAIFSFDLPHNTRGVGV